MYRNKEALKAYHRKYYLKNKAKILAQTKKYRLEHKEAFEVWRKTWEKKNRAKYLKGRARQARARQNRKRAWIQTFKAAPCADCGILYPAYVMDFDHVHGKKSFNLSLACSKSKQVILEEIAKCEIVCANCHRIRSHQRGN